MMGLTDRFEPWARRFQASPAPAPQAQPRPTAAPPPRDRVRVPGGEHAEPTPGRFARRALQER
jgi:hypothetical protein